MFRIASVMQVVAGAKSNLESALPGEWTMLGILFVAAAVLRAAVLAGGALEHRRLVARRVDRWKEYRREHRSEYRRARSGPGERPGGRECG